ncbi:MAG: endospore germination permease [Bacillota bacterium]
MTKKPFLTPTQLALMSVGSALVFPYTFMPILSAPPANQDAWIVLILTLVYILLINAPLLFIMNKFRGIQAYETLETILGKFFGKAACLIFVAFFVYCFTACSLITAVFINLYIFPETPTWALLIYMAVPVCYAAIKGAGTIGRLSTFIVPFIILTIILFFLLGIKKMDFEELAPVLADSTFLELNHGAFLTGARYSEILIFFVFTFYLKGKSSIIKTYAAALGVFFVSFLIILIPTLTVLGVELGKHAWNPYFMFTRQVEGYDFIERVQSLNALAWFPAALLKLMMYNYMGSYIFSGVVKAKSHKVFVLPITAIGFIICLLPVMNKSSTVEFLRSDAVFPFIVLPVIFVVPMILLVVYFFRRKKMNLILEQKKLSESASE